MKNFLRLLGLSLTIFLVFSCMTIQDVPPYTYTGDKAIYPAVHYAIVNGNSAYWRNSQISVPDPNTVVIEHVLVSDGIRLADFTLRISLVNNVVTYQFSNIRQKPPTGPDSDWVRVDRFSQSDRELIFTSYFNTEIPKVMENDALYARAKEAADRSLGGSVGGGALSYSLPLQNPLNYLLYPAVGAAFASLKGSLGEKTATIRDIYCLDNEFTIQGCVAERGRADLITYQIKITAQGNQLGISFVNIEPIGSYLMQYTAAEIEALPRFDTQRIADQLKTQIERNLASAAIYNEAKKAFLANNEFLYRAFAPVTRAMMSEFAAALFDGEIALSVAILDVRQNDNAEFGNYATAIMAGLYTESSVSRLFANITLYTNDASLARLRQSDRTTLSGQLVRLEYNAALTPSLTMIK
ncbi:MAG: hypothetical protein LBI14_08635 [Treponema sp.]|jgi:hypothetical protein|nr:hypothetical protein [Treponema sp.]